MAGLAGIQQQLLIRFTITGDATGGDEYTVTRLCRAVDAAAIITAGNAAGRTLRPHDHEKHMFLLFDYDLSDCYL